MESNDNNTPEAPKPDGPSVTLRHRPLSEMELEVDVLLASAVVGCIYIRFYQWGAYLRLIKIDEDKRRQGIGTKALNLLLAKFREIEVPKVMGDTMSDPVGPFFEWS